MATSEKKPAPKSQKVPPKDTKRLRRDYALVAEDAARDSLAERAALPDESPVEWAVIVNHGMGQQVHFETLELLALALELVKLIISDASFAKSIRVWCAAPFKHQHRKPLSVRKPIAVKGAK